LEPYQITLVQGSWSKVLPISDEAAERFYKRLFEKDPSTKTLFQGDIQAQSQKLTRMITTAVNGLNDLGRLVSVMKDLGHRHGGYGVEELHYGSFVSTLLWVLKQELGDDFTDDVKTAWTEMYMLLAGVMKDSAAKMLKAA